jgi:hypothetical protein
MDTFVRVLYQHFEIGVCTKGFPCPWSPPHFLLTQPSELGNISIPLLELGGGRAVQSPKWAQLPHCSHWPAEPLSRPWPPGAHCTLPCGPIPFLKLLTCACRMWAVGCAPHLSFCPAGSADLPSSLLCWDSRSFPSRSE